MKNTLLKRFGALLIALVILLPTLPEAAQAQTKTVTPRFFLQAIEQVTDPADIPGGYTPLYSTEDLQKIVDNPSGSFILMNSIDAGGFKALNHVTFQGTLEGNGHKLHNIDISVQNPSSNVFTAGLFHTLAGARVSNLCIQGRLFLEESCDNGGFAFIGGLAGFAWGDTQVYNCVADVDIACHESMMGFLPDTEGNYGGLIGCLDASGGAVVSYCRNLGSLEATDNAGGIVGALETYDASGAQPDIIYACLNDGPVFTRMQNAGGVVGVASNNAGEGDMRLVISNCANRAEVTGCWNVGGILGFADHDASGWTTVTDCLNAGRIVGTDAPVVCVGGVVGNGDCYVFSCVNAGSFLANVPSGIHTTIDEDHIFDCYYLDNVRGAKHTPDNQIIDSGRLSAVQMTLKQSYPGLNFDDIWVLEEGMEYPFPREVLIKSRWITYSADAGSDDISDLFGHADRESAVEEIMNGYEFTNEELEGTIICFAEGYGEYPGGGSNLDRSSALCVVWKGGEIIFAADNCATYPDRPTHYWENKDNNGNPGTTMPSLIDGKYTVIGTNHLKSKAGFNYPALKVQKARLCRITASGYYTETMASSSINIHAKSTESIGVNSHGCTIVGTAQLRVGGITNLPAENEYCRFAYLTGFAADSNGDDRAEIKSGIQHTAVRCTAIYNRSHGYDHVPEFRANIDADYADHADALQVILGRAG